jgi:hypothetical protein
VNPAHSVASGPMSSCPHANKRTKVRALHLSPDLGLNRGAGDENRTRTVSLGICSNRPKTLRSVPLARATACPRVTVTDPH